MSETENLKLPLVAEAQAQKHVTVNEALRRLDALVQLAVADRDLSAPPGAPAEGARYIVAAGPTGAWAGHAGDVAAYLDGAWEFLAPARGWIAFVADEALLVHWTGAAWAGVVAATSLQNLALLGVGTAADATNPFAAKLNKALWTARTAAEGGDGDLRYTMNKEAAADVLSILMQRGFSGRAEIGLVGDDDLTVKVSPDGSAWVEALRVDRTSGRLSCVGQIRFPAAANPSTDPNTLDDYEEGTFTPTLTAATTAPSGVTYTIQDGRYTKVGRLVLIEGRVAVSSLGSGGSGIAGIGSLPFAVGSVIGFTTQMRHSGFSVSSGAILSALAQGNGLYLQQLSNSGAGDVNWSSLGAATNIIFACTYTTG